jgi:hypothetical protein
MGINYPDLVPVLMIGGKLCPRLPLLLSRLLFRFGRAMLGRRAANSDAVWRQLRQRLRQLR